MRVTKLELGGIGFAQEISSMDDVCDAFSLG